MPNLSARRAQLTIYNPNGQTRAVALELEKYDVGRDPTSTLAFPDVQGLSRRHASIERTGLDWTIRDLGSTNGTFVNGKRLSETHVLHPQDRISAGALVLAYSEERPAPKPAAATMFFIDEEPVSLMREVETMEATLEGVLSSDPELKGSPHMRALIQAGRELCGSDTLDELFQVIVDLSIEAAGASRGVLITVEDGEFHVRAQKGAGFQISSHVRDLVIRQKRSLLVLDALSDAALAARKSIVQEQIRGILAVPLQTDKDVIGLIYLDAPIDIKEFTKDDLNVLTVLGNIAAIRIRQARLAEIEKAEMLRAQELEHAARIQRSIIPPEGSAFPNRKDFGLSASMIPAKEVGGDLYDYFLLDDERLGFVLGDVSGKGVAAGLYMAVTRTLLRATAENQKAPGECFTYMNNSLSEGGSGMYVTIFYGVLNTRTGELAYANGGHNPPLIFSRNGEVNRLVLGERLVGIFPGIVYKTQTLILEPGQGILLYTDGVTEATNRSGDFYGDARLMDYLSGNCDKTPSGLVQGLNEDVKRFAEGTPQADDITVLVLQRP
jgi:sigma-B regulation protein RsbU (phosphoserine phosphatase)